MSQSTTPLVNDIYYFKTCSGILVVLLIINPMDFEEFSLLLVGIISLIILYSVTGNFLEHKKVLNPTLSFTLFMRRESAS